MGKGDMLIFVEVRSRSRTDFGHPFETVTLTKQKKIIKTALQYVKTYGPQNAALRFDVVALEGDRLEHLENAFSVQAGRYTL
jgi:putative endonuclease